jgi:hypothetical protein
MWMARNEELPEVQGLRFSVSRNARQVSFTEVVDAWQNDTGFVDVFMQRFGTSQRRRKTYSPGARAGKIDRPARTSGLNSDNWDPPARYAPLRLRERRRDGFCALHSFVSVSKTSGDS